MGGLRSYVPWLFGDNAPRQNYVPVLGPRGFYRLAYMEWGDSDNPRVLMCVHGLTRLGRDFDYLARALSKEYRVVCPDMPGRGESDWWDYKTDYANPNYVQACATLIARLGVERVDWLGTSMGGIIGMLLAANPNAPIARLVLNDVGPFIPKAALDRIAAYTGKDARYGGIEDVEAMYRELAKPFGITKDEDWRFFARISSKPAEEGKWRLHYDPGIAMAFKVGPVTDVAFWPVWEAIKCPVLVLRGAESDLLLPQTAEDMTKRGPKAELAVIEGAGHAPALMAPDQIELIRNWLAKTA
ncbi:MAG TPA: alpha/beta hydrolase [Magnetospirillaceae bacterium]|jgi:pimeloyl-ACP methyl ester carboxylesterase